jgi:hypothetical protein
LLDGRAERSLIIVANRPALTGYEYIDVCISPIHTPKPSPCCKSAAFRCQPQQGVIGEAQIVRSFLVRRRGGVASKTEASTGVYRFLFPSRQSLRNEQCFHSQCPHTCLLRATPCTSRSPRLDSTQHVLARNLVREHMYPFSQPRRCTAA